MNIEEEHKKREGFNVVRLQHLNPNKGTCNRCGLPWSECESKSIMYSDNGGIFAMCEFCWSQSGLQERLHHYKTLWYDHKNRWNHHYNWLVVEKNITDETNRELAESGLLHSS